MERFAKILNGYKLFGIFEKRFTFDVWQGSEYAFEILCISYQRYIKDPTKHIWWSLFRKIINGSKLLTIVVRNTA